MLTEKTVSYNVYDTSKIRWFIGIRTGSVYYYELTLSFQSQYASEKTVENRRAAAQGPQEPPDH